MSIEIGEDILRHHGYRRVLEDYWFHPLEGLVRNGPGHYFRVQTDGDPRGTDTISLWVEDIVLRVKTRTLFKVTFLKKKPNICPVSRQGLAEPPPRPRRK